MDGRSKVLIVDSNQVEAQNLEHVVRALGYGVLNLPADARQAINFATSANIDVAIIDAQSGEGQAYPIARIMQRRLIPYFFTTTGSRESPRDAGFKDMTLAKPLDRAVIEKLLIYLLNRPR
jgi:CheY-like chemotaxis protein